MEVTFDFWTNLCGCGGGNVGGSCKMEMTEEESIDTRRAIKKAFIEIRK